MKIHDIPQSGRKGPMVMFRGRNGLVGRSFVIPKDPRTERQLETRSLMAEEARRLSQLTEEQIDAWNAAAATYRSAVRLNQSGPLSGLQLFIKLNCKLRRLGFKPLDRPPRRPVFPDLAPESLVITNTRGRSTLKLACYGSPGSYTVLRASPPKSLGTLACRDFRILGMCPPAKAGYADITALYTAQFGPPPPGRRIFVRVTAMFDGLESAPKGFHARVPSA